MPTKSNWPTGDYPVLINPTDYEVAAFSDKEKWDTLRICVSGENIAIGSGHGNTHDSITKLAQMRYPDTYILFRVDGRFYFNMEDTGGKRKTSLAGGLRYFSERHGEIIADLCQQR